MCEPNMIVCLRLIARGAAALFGFVMNLVFVVVGIVLALWYENLGRPRLSVAIHGVQTDIRVREGPDSTWKATRFITVTVTNEPRRVPLVRRQTAQSCHGTITFETREGAIVAGPMKIRWNETPEPFRIDSRAGQPTLVLEPWLIRAGGFIDIPPDESVHVSPAFRISGDTDSYGWTTKNYEKPAWRHDKLKLPPGEYIARIEVVTGDGRFPAAVPFVNPSEFDGFGF